jgi:GT2 family glycosyltransferase
MAVTGLILPGELETESQLAFEIGYGNFGWGYRARTFDTRFFEATKHLGVPVWRIGAGANMAFRRRAFELVGYFDERLGAGAAGCSEDSELWYRVLAEGWLCFYDPSAVVYHYHRRDFGSLKGQMREYMRGHVAALLIQFGKYRHWGNLFRLCVSLPEYYAKSLLKGLLRGFDFRHRTFLTELWGCFLGVKFYLQNPNP